MHFTPLLPIFLLALGHASLLTFATPLGPGVARRPMLQGRRCAGDTCRDVVAGEPSSTVSVAWSQNPTTSASATPAPAEPQGDTTLGNISKSDWTLEPSPTLAAESSSSANAGVVLAPRNILHGALLSGGIVAVLML